MRHSTLSGSILVGAVVLAQQACGSSPNAKAPSAESLHATSRMVAGDPGPRGLSVLKNGTFDEGTLLPWSPMFSTPAAGKAEIARGELCFAVSARGKNAYDVLLRQRPVTLRRHRAYTLRFSARSTVPTRIRPSISLVTPTLAEVWSAIVPVEQKPKVYHASVKITEPVLGDAELVIQLGGALVPAETPFTLCLDDIELQDPDYEPPPGLSGPPRPRIRVNQLGYLPRFPKRATLKDPSPGAVGWALLDAAGRSVARGSSQPFGEDRDAGEFVHVIDFSAFRQPGTGYTLSAGAASSPPFSIAHNLYSRLRVDALRFFFHNRSGIAIEMPFAGEPQWARPAGHTGDRTVPCGEGTGCSYSLDVSGGWYDAGDHGKYVVNGGIAVWTLLNLYEHGDRRTVTLGGDRTLEIPESGNGVPDLLDEARWEIEWMMKMQVPPGQALAGMVHHKVHDVQWTAIPTAPHEDAERRTLRPPSTAATLNLAAVGAQASRIWRTLDPKFSGRCLLAAESAYRAANAHPSMFARGDDNVGGGPYGDQEVNDELYWAAAELFVTTGRPEYLRAVRGSRHFLKVPVQAGGGNSSMAWNNVSALGTITLAVVSSRLPKGDVALARQAIVAAAREYAGDVTKRGYLVPFESASGRYPWGSNSFVLNNALVLGLGYQLTRRNEYLVGAIDAMDYLLGRNPLSQSYVTGYGTYPLQNPHHRFWARQQSDAYPPPPPGVVSGGPNSQPEDPAALAAGLGGCIAQQCFVDHIQSWSTNEVAINWNAPLAWVAAFVDDAARAR